ncbi:unnamed protein product [Linum trigynum]|uniref:Reverse transcriptase Ty1/copia-type domain-containing protein n=1 Tax=Linum trigynum TaxID=586398 RepID=A0AAV2CLQ4_9ROSI
MLTSRDVIFHETRYPFQADTGRELHWVPRPMVPAVEDHIEGSTPLGHTTPSADQPLSPTPLRTVPPTHPQHGSPLSTPANSPATPMSMRNESQGESAITSPAMHELASTPGGSVGEHLEQPPEDSIPSPAVPEPPVPPVRRGDRARTRPKHLDAYDMAYATHAPSASPVQGSEASPVRYPLASYVTYDNFKPHYHSFLAAITQEDEPLYFHEAVRHKFWRDAMTREIVALQENGTWTLVALPPGKRAIASKWVYKIKYLPDGTIERYKARLVAKGYTQIEGLDFHDTFAPVAKLVTVRCLIAVAVSRGWDLQQLDVNNAFLHGDLEEEVYMEIPQGFRAPGDNRVCRLHKSIYGLRQASRNWYQKFTATLCKFGFRASSADHSLFIYHHGQTFFVALIYVDDVILTGNDSSFIAKVKTFLHDRFSIKDLGPLRYFLGIEVARTAEGVSLSQRKYVLDILEDAGQQASRPSPFPIEQNHQLTRPTDDVLADPSPYRRMVGILLYLTVTRPDITYAVNILSQFVNAPSHAHMEAAHRVLRYLKASPGQGLFFPITNPLRLTAYCDADWGGCQSTRRSTTGYFISLGGAPRNKELLLDLRQRLNIELWRALLASFSGFGGS